MSAEAQAAREALAHEIDAREISRTRVLRSLVWQHELLTDGQHALANGRGNVAAEFMARAAEAIAREIELLREDGKRNND